MKKSKYKEATSVIVMEHSYLFIQNKNLLKMKVTTEKKRKIEKLIFASTYPHYVKKLEKKGRTKAELHHVANVSNN
jgi:hypothetical protein